MTDLILIEQTIPSMEVADMVEMEHKYLMRNIRRYTDEMTGAQISPVEFWNDSLYKDSKGENRPCYLVTKKGCEFIAHKMTGAKGTIFTARYINRFHYMENALKTQNTTSYEALPGMSKSSVPKISSWYTQNKDRIARICEKNGWKNKELYHKILEHVGQTYNIGAAKKIYRKENGFYPPYVMDVVGYFPELAEMANDFLNQLDI